MQLAKVHAVQIRAGRWNKDIYIYKIHIFEKKSDYQILHNIIKTFVNICRKRGKKKQKNNRAAVSRDKLDMMSPLKLYILNNGHIKEIHTGGLKCKMF